MKLIDIVNARNVLNGLADHEDICAHLSYMMTKLIVNTQTDADFYTKELQKLFDKYGENNDKGELVVKAENIEEFQRDVKTLQDTEATDPGIRLSLKELAQLKFSMKQMYAMMPFINEDEE